MDKRREQIRFILLQIVLAVSLSLIISSGMKVFFEEPRPCENEDGCPESFSFPSRHAAAAFSIATIFIIWSRTPAYKVLAFIAAALIGFWRVYIGFHTITDVVAGAIIGIVLGIFVYYLVKSRKKYKKYYK